jgi:hypothetical protein
VRAPHRELGERLRPGLCPGYGTFVTRHGRTAGAASAPSIAGNEIDDFFSTPAYDSLTQKASRVALRRARIGADRPVMNDDAIRAGSTALTR